MYTGFIQTEEPAGVLTVGVSWLTARFPSWPFHHKAYYITGGLHEYWFHILHSVNSEQYEEWISSEWNILEAQFDEKALGAFVWQKVHLLKGPTWPVQHPCCFCFQPWEHLGFASSHTKKSLNCISPSPHPPHHHLHSNLQGCLTFASKWRAAGTKCLCHILLAVKGQFSYLWSIFPWSHIIWGRPLINKMPPSKWYWCH